MIPLKKLKRNAWFIAFFYAVTAAYLYFAEDPGLGSGFLHYMSAAVQVVLLLAGIANFALLLAAKVSWPSKIAPLLLSFFPVLTVFYLLGEFIRPQC